MSKPKIIARIRKGQLVDPQFPSRVSRWQNKKKYGKQVCNGHYLFQQGGRRFVLANDELRVMHIFDSHEAAKAWGWIKLK